MARRKNEFLRVATFIAVGVAAAATHWCVAVGLATWAGGRPLMCNLAGWLVAMSVSFGGHQWLTFGDLRARASQSFPRFLAVSAAGFVVNAASVGLLLHAGGVRRFDLALAVTLVAVAGLTFLFSRLWVFARHEKMET